MTDYRYGHPMIRCRSVTPADEGCQRLLIEHLAPLGFHCETIQSGGVTNLWAVRRGRFAGPLVVLAGHTDVVPTGPFPPTHLVTSFQLPVALFQVNVCVALL